jgi:hypothetical protein
LEEVWLVEAHLSCSRADQLLPGRCCRNKWDCDGPQRHVGHTMRASRGRGTGVMETEPPKKGGDVNPKRRLVETIGRMGSPLSSWTARRLALLGGAGSSFVLLWALMRYRLGLRGLVSDLQVYWHLSYSLDTPFSAWFPPGYPALIAMGRVLMPRDFDSLLLLQLLNLLVFLLGVGVVASGPAGMGYARPKFPQPSSLGFLSPA